MNWEIEPNIIWFTGEGKPQNPAFTQGHYKPSGTLVHHNLSPNFSLLRYSRAPPSNISDL